MHRLRTAVILLLLSPTGTGGMAAALPDHVSIEDAQAARIAQLEVRALQLEVELTQARLEAKKAEAALVVVRMAIKYALDPSRGDGWDERLVIHRAAPAPQKDAKP